MGGQLKALAGLQVVEVVEGLCVKEDAEAVGLADLAAPTDVLVALRGERKEAGNLLLSVWV